MTYLLPAIQTDAVYKVIDRPHSMRDWQPELGAERDEYGIQRDPKYSPSTIPYHKLRVYGGRGNERNLTS